MCVTQGVGAKWVLINKTQKLMKLVLIGLVVSNITITIQLYLSFVLTLLTIKVIFLNFLEIF